MSSKQTDTTSKRVMSISQELAMGAVGRRIVECFWADAGTIILLTLCYLLTYEWTTLGSLSWEMQHGFHIGEHWYEFIYYVKNPAGMEVITLPIWPQFRILLIVMCAFFFLQIFGALLAIPKYSRKIRKTLRPINEVALKAEQLSKMSFNENQYQEIEDAISHMKLDSDKPLNIGDDDLQGIETALNNMLLQLRDSYAQQARFVNDASHELRTPIAVIQGYANMLDRWGKEDEKVLEESISAIKHESDHMKYLVEQLLFLARGDAGRMKIEYVEKDLVELMREVYEESLMIDEKHPYRFSLPKDWDKDRKLICCVDENLLKQAVRILVDNAAKYTNEHDEIILSCGINEKSQPYLQVQDTGIGMAENDVAHMFERFYRADEARSYDGTGLGLSIAKWIVDKHKGHFEIVSRTELGTRIRIILD